MDDLPQYEWVYDVMSDLIKFMEDNDLPGPQQVLETAEALLHEEFGRLKLRPMSPAPGLL